MTEQQNADEDRYRPIGDVIERIVHDDDIAEHQVTRVDVRLLASGEAVYNVWVRDLEEPLGGYLEPPS